MDLRELLFLKAMKGGGGGYVQATATGNPLTFNTDIAKPLKSLLIPWTPSQSGSGDPSPENVRPISGVSAVTVYHSGSDTSNPDTINVTFPALGKNLLNVLATQEQASPISSSADTKRTFVPHSCIIGMSNGNYYRAVYDNYVKNVTLTKNTVQFTSGTATGYGIAWTIDEAKPGMKLTISVGNRTNNDIGLMYYQSDGTFIKREIYSTNKTIFTVPDDATTVLFFVVSNAQNATISVENPMVEIGETQSTYEPYTNTVYGGSLDLTTGVLTVEWVLVNSKNATWISSSYDDVYSASFALPKKPGVDNFVIDEYKTVTSRFADLVDYDARGNAANNYVYVKNSSIDSPQGFSETDFNICYELATPYTIQLPATVVTALVGDNTIWSDTNGSNTAVYLKRG